MKGKAYVLFEGPRRWEEIEWPQSPKGPGLPGSVTTGDLIVIPAKVYKITVERNVEMVEK